MIITALLCTIGILVVALWLGTMALWWQAEEGLAARILERNDIVHQWHKAARLARRNWYDSLRHSKRAFRWSNKKAGAFFVALFPKARPAFVEQDMLTGLQHGPSSYYLANLSKKLAKAASRKPYVRRKKISEMEPVAEAQIDLSEE